MKNKYIIFIYCRFGIFVDIYIYVSSVTFISCHGPNTMHLKTIMEPALNSYQYEPAAMVTEVLWKYCSKLFDVIQILIPSEFFRSQE